MSTTTTRAPAGATVETAATDATAPTMSGAAMSFPGGPRRRGHLRLPRRGHCRSMTSCSDARHPCPGPPRAGRRARRRGLRARPARPAACWSPPAPATNAVTGLTDALMDSGRWSA